MIHINFSNCQEKIQRYLNIFYKEHKIFEDRYLSEELIVLLNRWSTDKKKRDYYTILDEILFDNPVEKQINFIEYWSETIPKLSNDYHYSDPREEAYQWSSMVRKGEIMVKKAIELKLLNTIAWPELMSAAEDILPEFEINKLVERYDGLVPVWALWHVVKEYTNFIEGRLREMKVENLK